MNPLMQESGEIKLLCEDKRTISVHSLQDWQSEELIENANTDSTQVSNACLKNIDKIVDDWLKELGEGEWTRLRIQESLRGITIPQGWIEVWRIILKEPSLRNPEDAAKRGRNLNSFTYVWNIWAEECVNKYLDPLDKDILTMVDAGYPYNEIGETMLKKYGDKFWKPRKRETTTTPSQVVNNYLYLKLPKKIVRRELYNIAQLEIKKRNKKRPHSI